MQKRPAILEHSRLPPTLNTRWIRILATKHWARQLASRRSPEIPILGQVRHTSVDAVVFGEHDDGDHHRRRPRVFVGSKHPVNRSNRSSVLLQIDEVVLTELGC